ncbi:hypothetical protein CR513_20433, partial [Mucuna pruriens]
MEGKKFLVQDLNKFRWRTNVRDRKHHTIKPQKIFRFEDLTSFTLLTSTGDLANSQEVIARPKGYCVQVSVQEETNNIKKEGEKFKACLVVQGFFSCCETYFHQGNVGFSS